MRMLRVAGIAFALVATGPARAQGHGWTRAWTASLWQGTNDQVQTVEGVTIRSLVRIGAGGERLRLRLGNDHSAVAVRIGAATIRRANGQVAHVTFGGAVTARIEARAPLVSDPVALPVSAFELVEVALYLPDRTTLTTVHAAGGSPTAVSPPGDHSAMRFDAV